MKPQYCIKYGALQANTQTLYMSVTLIHRY